MLLNVVNYGTDNNKTTLFDIFKNKESKISDNFKTLARMSKSLDIDPSSFGGWKAWASVFDKTDRVALKFFADVDSGTRKIEDVDTYMQSATQSTSQFSTTLKNIAVNALPILAISAIIQLAQAGWDALNVTVEEQDAKVNNLQAAYQNLSSEYEQLSGKQDLTEAEKNRLSYLERRLALDERILKAEKSQLFEEKTGSKFTDLFDKDNLETQYKKEMAGTDGEWNLLSGFTQNRDGYAYLSGLYERKLDGIRITALLPARIQEDIMQSTSLYCGGLQTGRLMKQKNQPTTKPKRRKILWAILQMNPGTILKFQPVKRQKPRNLKKPLLTGSLNFRIS